VSEAKKNPPSLNRRAFLTRLAMAASASPLASIARAATSPDAAKAAAAAPDAAGAEPFWGEHQGGITTPAQAQTFFAAFDLTAAKRSNVVDLMRAWTEAAALMASGRPAASLDSDASQAPADSGEVLGLPPSRLTVTFGFGTGLFVKNGKDRYGLAKRRPEALIDLPRFNGDQLVEGRTGGDLSVQACADDPQVAFHAIRQFARLAYGAAEIRWAQTGFVPGYRSGETPRNLMGFKDGTMNPSVKDLNLMNKHIWVGEEGPVWMRGGSYMVIRPSRIALEHWDRMKLAFQEQVVGRQKYSGAPLGKKNESDALDLEANDGDGNPLIPESAHARLAAAQKNGGAQILRRAYSYNNGVSFTAERWPPWHQGMEFDAGLLFQCYQRDPRAGFVKIFEEMSKFDTMNQFVTHVGSGLFACPGGAAEGEFIGRRLFA
jgi:deferrochelatase/peroxidase EfeB